MRQFHIGAQNDALFIISGERPATTNDYPRHDADRTCIAKVYDEAEARRLVDAANAGLASAPQASQPPQGAAEALEDAAIVCERRDEFGHTHRDVAANVRSIGTAVRRVVDEAITGECARPGYAWVPLEALTELSEACTQSSDSPTPILGYMVHTGDTSEAALFNTSQRADAEDAARRWKASITALTVCHGSPVPQAPQEIDKHFAAVVVERNAALAAKPAPVEVAQQLVECRRAVYRLRSAVRDDSGAGASREAYEAAIAAEESLIAAIERLAAIELEIKPERRSSEQNARLWAMRVAELEVDAERLDWLNTRDGMHFAVLRSIVFSSPSIWRAAIDTARKAKP